MKVTLECLICNAEIIVKDRIFEHVDELTKLWEKQHESCRAQPVSDTGPGLGGRWENGCTSPYGHRFGSARCTHCGDPSPPAVVR